MRKCKPKKCRWCGKEFYPWVSTQINCTPGCAIDYVKDKEDKKLRRDIKTSKAIERKSIAKRKEALKSRRDYINDLQTVVNKYARLRDSGKPCCSCDKPDNGLHQRHASHYRSTAACSVLRFNLKNIHTSCQQCNTTKSGNILEYRIRLVKRFGEDYVLWLESQNQTIKYDIDYLIRFRKIFLKRVRVLEKKYNEV